MRDGLRPVRDVTLPPAWPLRLICASDVWGTLPELSRLTSETKVTSRHGRSRDEGASKAVFYFQKRLTRSQPVC
jgi:hypothetical protein